MCGTIPPRPQVDQAGRRILQLAGEAKGRHAATLGRAPGVVGDDAQRRRSRVEGAAHAAERVGGVPGRGAAVERGQAAQAVHVVGRGRCADLALEDLGERRGEILGVQRRGTARGLRHQRAVAVVGVGRRAALRHTAERVVAVGRGTFGGQVAGVVVGVAGIRDLVGEVVGRDRRRAAVDLHRGTVPARS